MVLLLQTAQTLSDPDADVFEAWLAEARYFWTEWTWETLDRNWKRWHISWQSLVAVVLRFEIWNLEGKRCPSGMKRQEKIRTQSTILTFSSSFFFSTQTGATYTNRCYQWVKISRNINRNVKQIEDMVIQRSLS